MKVALLAHSRFPIAAPFAGGLESFVWHLTRELRRQGIDVVLVAGPGSDRSLGAEEIQPNVPALGELALLDPAMPPADQVHDTIAYLSVMQRFAQRRDVDLIHNNSLHYVPIALSSTLCQPVLTTLHSPPTPWMEPALALTPGAPTVAVSAAIADAWRHVTSPTVIHNGVDVDAWAFGDGGPDLIWAGRIVPEKAPHLAIAVARATGRGLRIVGPIHDRCYFEAHVAPWLDERIRYQGHAGPAHLQRMLATSAACLVTPVWAEPFALIAAEAMACGTPVLGLDRGGLGEVAQPPGGAVASPGLVETDAVAAMVDMLDDVCRLERRVVRAHAVERFSLGRTAAQYIDIYRELVGT